MESSRERERRRTAAHTDAANIPGHEHLHSTRAHWWAGTPTHGSPTACAALARHLQARAAVALLVDERVTLDLRLQLRYAVEEASIRQARRPGHRHRRRWHDALRRAPGREQRRSPARRQSRPARISDRCLARRHARAARRCAGRQASPRTGARCWKPVCSRSGRAEATLTALNDVVMQKWETGPHARFRDLDRRPLCEHARRRRPDRGDAPRARPPMRFPAAVRSSSPTRRRSSWCRSARTR